MIWIDQAISEFGRALGFSSLELGPDHEIEFRLESGALLGLRYLPHNEPVPELVVYCSRAIDYGNVDAVRNAMRFSDFRMQPSWSIQSMIDDNGLTLVIRVPERDVMSSSLQAAVSHLFEMQRRVHDGR